MPVCQGHGAMGSVPAVGWSGHKDPRPELPCASSGAVRSQPRAELPHPLCSGHVSVQVCTLFQGTEQRQQHPTWADFIPLSPRAVPTTPVSYTSWP